MTMPTQAAPPEPCMIVRLLPPVGDEPVYRVRSMLDGQERVLPEGEIGAGAGARRRG